MEMICFESLEVLERLQLVHTLSGEFRLGLGAIPSRVLRSVWVEVDDLSFKGLESVLRETGAQKSDQQLRVVIRAARVSAVPVDFVEDRNSIISEVLRKDYSVKFHRQKQVVNLEFKHLFASKQVNVFAKTIVLECF